MYTAGFLLSYPSLAFKITVASESQKLRLDAKVFFQAYFMQMIQVRPWRTIGYNGPWYWGEVPLNKWVDERTCFMIIVYPNLSGDFTMAMTLNNSNCTTE